VVFGAAKSGYSHRWVARCQSPFFVIGGGYRRSRPMKKPENIPVMAKRQ